MGFFVLMDLLYLVGTRNISRCAGRFQLEIVQNLLVKFRSLANLTKQKPQVLISSFIGSSGC